jgi:hypothetical protein
MVRFAWVLVPLVAACGDGSTAADMSMPATSRCPMPVAPTCTDAQIQDLTLFKAASTRAISNTPDGSGFASEIDATAGGSMPPRESYVYARFTATGLEQVAIGDEAAFNSMEWDIAFRRFVIRLNSGVSGPSCVDGARTAANTDYDALATEPASLEYRTEAYYTQSCSLVPDGSGLGSPGTALQSFWRYPGCVQMTGNVFVVRLADGRKVKLVVTHYYEPAVQDYCDANDTVMMGDLGKAAKVGVRWAFLGG